MPAKRFRNEQGARHESYQRETTYHSFCSASFVHYPAVQLVSQQQCGSRSLSIACTKGPSPTLSSHLNWRKKQTRDVLSLESSGGAL